LGGEPIKAQLLKENQGLSLKQGLSSQIIAKTTFLTGLILFFIPGIVMILISPKVSEEFKTISLIGMGTFSTCIFYFLFSKSREPWVNSASGSSKEPTGRT
jgi:pilus assembly protein TadC